MKSLKFLPLLITVFICNVIGAQTSNVNTARIRLNNQDVKDAKKYIDLAAENEETKNSSKMWLTRGDVYYAIATAPDSTKEGLVILLLDRDAKSPRLFEKLRRAIFLEELLLKHIRHRPVERLRAA